jgi:hypothetical protein
MISFWIFFCSTGVWTQGLHLEALHQSFLFVMGFFEIGSGELFAQASFKPWSSWSLPPEWLGLQVWATGTWHFFFFNFWDLFCGLAWSILENILCTDVKKVYVQYYGCWKKGSINVLGSFSLQYNLTMMPLCWFVWMAGCWSPQHILIKYVSPYTSNCVCFYVIGYTVWVHICLQWLVPIFSSFWLYFFLQC